ncbi:MAG: YfhO family protein [Chitinispirillales bacterium]|jgi:hypothetical protein|nr:YfhO family protein [Chitinispirillales bacterium]
MSKKKKPNQKARKIPDQNLLKPMAEPFFTLRRSFVVSIGVLAVLWLIQFYSLLVGNVHFWEDIVLQDFPVRIFSRAAFYQFEFPHWNPFAFNGVPFFAAQVPGVLYPFNVLLSLLPVSDEVFWRLLQAGIAFHILIAGVTMLVYLRFKKRSYTASVFGAAAFMFGGFLITHLVHTMMVYILAWFPLVLLFLEKSIREIKFTHAVQGGLLLGLTMLAGHPQFTFYEFIFLFAVSAFLLFQIRERLVKRITVITAFFSIAAGLSLVQYLPSVELSGLTLRADYTINDASEGSLQFVQLLTALMPKVFGAYTGSTGIPPFWLEDSFRHGYYNYWETCFYFGVSTLILSCFWFRKIKTKRSVLFVTLWILGSFAIALGGNFFVFRTLFSLGVPGFTGFRHVARILFTWNFLFPFIAAIVLDSLDELKSKKLKTASLSICFAAMALGIFTAAGGLKSIFPLMNVVEARAQYVSEQGLILLLNAGFMAAVLIMFFKDVIKIKTAKVLIAGCLAVDMLIFAAGQHVVSGGGGAPQEFNRAKASVDWIKGQSDKEIFRFNSRQFIVTSGSEISKQSPLMLMNKNQGTVSGIHITEGYTPLLLKHYMPTLDAEKFGTVLDLLNVKYYVNPYLKKDEQNVVLHNTTYLPRAKLFYKSKIISGDDSLVLNYMNSPQYDHHNEVVISEGKGKPPAVLSGQTGNGKAEITEYKFNRIKIDVKTDREAILWLSDIWYPAWKAAVNGKKTDVYRANYSFRAVSVPAGESKVIFHFSSTLFNVGALLSLLTLLVCLTVLIARGVKKR